MVRVELETGATDQGVVTFFRWRSTLAWSLVLGGGILALIGSLFVSLIVVGLLAGDAV